MDISLCHLSQRSESARQISQATALIPVALFFGVSVHSQSASPSANQNPGHQTGNAKADLHRPISQVGTESADSVTNILRNIATLPCNSQNAHRLNTVSRICFFSGSR